MIRFFSELRRRNAPLYWFGWYNMIMGIICVVLTFVDDQQLLGINRWIKPMKFFLSVGLVIWSLGWFMFYLDNKRKVRIRTWVIIVSMFFENFIIVMQSFRGKTSHFNSSTALDGILFNIMGALILVFTISVIIITITFFRQRQFAIPDTYLWGIRIGLVLFLIFSIQGGVMVGNMGHTIGGPDGGPGLPLVNWSTEFGDLRIAHFLGMHALQILPLAGYYIFRKTRHLVIFSVIYFLLVVAILIMALSGNPLLG